ncbi:MAG: cytochrome-c peroxidase [Rubrivivax sp.]|nr:MAG: cytochrome-c peroxidase [Rubrivivax sp.]
MRAHLQLLLTWAIALFGAVLLALGAGPQPAAAQDAQTWGAEELAVLSSLRLSQLPPPPNDASNRFEDSPAAAALGQRLFFDVRLSRNGAVSCASCHDPARQFQDGRATSVGQGVGSRRAMPVVGAGYSPWLFWDGRKDSLWSQALGPLEDAAEHGGNRLRYARLLQSHYQEPYEALFGPLPSLDGLPHDASPLGTAAERAAWQSMDSPSRDAVSRVFANLGKALAAYEKGLRHEPSRLDAYAERTGSLDARELNGLRLFIGKAQCISCHQGPLFTDQHFHNTGVPPRNAAAPDRGRAAALAEVRQDEFNCLGPFSDAQPAQCQELRFLVKQDPTLEGAFKTPSLRGVASRPPYMHAGQFATLEAVVRHYVEAPHTVVGKSELGHRHASAALDPHARQPIELTPAEQQDLVALLRAL